MPTNFMDQIFSNMFQTETVARPGLAAQRYLSEQEREQNREQLLREREQAKLEVERERYLADPTIAEKQVAHLTRNFVPTDKQEKLGYGANLSKVEKAIPESDPRRLIGQATFTEAMQNINDNPRIKPQKIILDTFLKNVEVAKPSTYKYLDEQQKGWLGLPFTGKEVGKEVASMPGYREYLIQKDKESLAKPIDVEKFSSPVEAAAQGLGFAAGGMGLQALAKSGILGAAESLLPRAVGGLGKMMTPLVKNVPSVSGKLIAAALISIPEIWAAQAAGQLVERSDFAKENPTLGKVAEFAASLAAGGGVNLKLSSGVNKYFTGKNLLQEVGNKIASPSGVLAENLVDTELQKELKAANSVIRSKGKVDPNIMDVAKTMETEGVDINTAANKVANEGVQYLNDSTKLFDSFVKDTLPLTKKGTINFKNPSEEYTLYKSMIAEKKPIEEIQSSLQALKDKKNIAKLDTEINNPVESKVSFIEPLESELPKINTKFKPPTVVEESTTGISIPKNDTVDKVFQESLTYKPALTGEGLKSTAFSSPEEAKIASSEKVNLPKKEESSILGVKFKDSPSSNATSEEWNNYITNLPANKFRIFELKLDELGEKTPTNIRSAYSNLLDKRIADIKTSELKLVDIKNDINTQSKVLDAANKVGILDRQLSTDEFSTLINKGSRSIVSDINPPVVTALTREKNLIPEALKQESVGYEELSKSRKLADIDAKFEAGKITEEQREKLYNKIQGVKGKDLILPLALATAATVPLSMVFADKADAATISPRLPGVVTQFVADLAQRWKGGSKELLESLYDRGLVVNPYTQGSYNLKLGKSITIPPFEQGITRTGTTTRDSFTSPNIVAEQVMGSHNPVTGERNLSNIMNQVASHTSTANMNEINYTSAYKDILKNYKSDPEVFKEITEATAPLTKGNADMRILATAEGVATEYAKLEERAMIKALKTTGEDRVQYNKVADVYRQAKENALSKVEEMQPAKEAFESQYKGIMLPLAEKYPTVRMSLAATGEGMSPENPWIRNLLQPDELIAIARLKGINDVVKNRIIEVGGDVIESKPYLHQPLHPMDKMQDYIKENLKGLTTDDSAIMPLSKLYHRNFGSKLMIPDINYISEKYAADVFKRIEGMDLWRPGQKDGWAAFKTMAQNSNMPAVTGLLNQIEKGMMPQADTFTNKAANAYYALEAFRLLALSPSVSFKHAMKLISNLANMGVETWTKSLPQAFNLVRKDMAADAVDALYKKGLVSAPGVRDLETQAYKTFTNSNRMTRVTQDLADSAPENWWNKTIEKASDIGGSLLNAVERFDRGVSYTGAMDMAAKKGFTAEQAAYGIYDNILKTNYLSGVQNPEWLRNPLVRTMFMFQGTPFKILEQRLALAIRGGKDISEGTKQLFNDLQNLKGDIKEGERIFKEGIIKDAISTATKHKDIWGVPYSTQLIRNLLASGTVLLGGAKLFDADLKGHLTHMPFANVEEGKYKVSVNPMVNALLTAKTGEDEEFWPSAFAKKWMSQGPLPQMIIKGKRLSEDDIPDRYKGSDGKVKTQLRYLFGIPHLKDEE